MAASLSKVKTTLIMAMFQFHVPLTHASKHSNTGNTLNEGSQYKCYFSLVIALVILMPNFSYDRTVDEMANKHTLS